MKDSEINRWKKSRGGAWAGRGFHYQHLFTTLLLVRQWAGVSPAGYIVPEGLEDCVVELPNCEIWIQIKSRECGTFSEVEVKSVLSEVGRKAALVKNRKKKLVVLGLEQPYSGPVLQNLDQLFNGKPEKVVVCKAPEEDLIKLLLSRLDTAEIIAEGVANDLYKYVAETSAANASLSFKNRKRISITDVERKIFQRLEAEDPSAIDWALTSRALEPIDFVTSVHEPGFYHGVKVNPGHVAAGLVLARPKASACIINSLKKHRHMLITGPSGAGKSALIWLVANSLAAESRWFQITDSAGAHDADAIVRFLRARKPRKTSPISLVFDEVGALNSDLWDILVRELRRLPDVYLLGSIRNEDVNLITNHADAAVFSATLDEKIAESIWEQLTKQKQTTWPHWREPFEQSNDLMLEYIHILTQGDRLDRLINEQVHQREREMRHDELAIIRITSELCIVGGEIDTRKLFALLELSQERASQALKRLINEHLVRESRPGVLGGLHTLRSKALSDASHDDIVYRRDDSLWKGIRALTTDTLPRIIQSLFAERQKENDENALKKIADILDESSDVDFWVAILTGLGLGTLERRTGSFISILKRHGVQRAQWSLASMFGDSGIDIPDLSQFEQWQILRNAIIEYRALPKIDLRATCLKMLPKECQIPDCSNLRQANKLLSCLVPIAGGDPIQITFLPKIPADIEYDIRDISALLSTSFLIAPEFAKSLADEFGGEQALLSLFRSQTAWISTPIIEPEGIHGRTVRSNWYLVAEEYQTDPHDTICNICETLIALSPASDAAASDAIDPSGQLIMIGDYIPWSKNINRVNLPAKSRVAWNVAFRQILLARAAEGCLTDYALQMSELVSRTERIFRLFTEKWIKGAKTGNVDQLVAEITKIIKEVNSLAHAKLETPAASMTQPAVATEIDDKLGSLIGSVLGNLTPRIGKLPAEPGAKAAAIFAGSLAAQAHEQEKSSIWRTTSSPPLSKLAALANRLTDIAFILHELAYDDTKTKIDRMVKVAKKGRIGKAIQSTARYCRTIAEQRLREKINSFETELNKTGLTVECQTRTLDEADSIYWPPREIAVLVEIEDFEKEAGYIENAILKGREHFGQDWRFSFVPVFSGQVISKMAILSSSKMPLPYLKFAEEWQNIIDLPFSSSEITVAFERAFKSCREISGILNCRDLNTLHPEENDVIYKVIDEFKRNRELLDIETKKTELDELKLALAYLDKTWDQVTSEYEAKKTSKTVENPLCVILTEDENEKSGELNDIIIQLLKAECRMVTL